MRVGMAMSPHEMKALPPPATLILFSPIPFSPHHRTRMIFFLCKHLENPEKHKENIKLTQNPTILQ